MNKAEVLVIDNNNWEEVARFWAGLDKYVVVTYRHRTTGTVLFCDSRHGYSYLLVSHVIVDIEDNTSILDQYRLL